MSGLEQKPPAPSPESLFPTKGAISEAQQIGRGEAIDEIVGRLIEGDDIVVIEPRRVGKSSTIRNGALVRLRHAYGAVIAQTDLRLGGVTDAPSLANALVESAIETGAGRPLRKAQAGRLLARTKRFVTGERAGAAAGLAGEHAKLKTAQTLLEVIAGDDPTKHLHRVLDLLEVEASSHARPVVVFVDEVQDLGDERWKEDGTAVQQELERAMRREDRLVSFVFAGSQQNAMERVFAKGQPLHLEGERYRLPPIAATAWETGLIARFARDSRALRPEAVELILRVTEGHPLRTMQVCKQILRQARRQGATDIPDALIDDAISAAKEHVSWVEMP